MHDYLLDGDNEPWDIMLDGPLIPTIEVKYVEIIEVVPNIWQHYNEADKKKIEKSYEVKKILVCGIVAEQYNLVFACELAKEI